jgi:4-hydroxybenzoate polyprenyltransferase
MVFARTVAMIANRLLDRDIDKLNPRTVNRAIPSGRLATSSAFAALSICAIGFFVVCTLFGLLFQNWWPAILGPFVLVWISSYAWLKRFTSLCHIYLGSSLAISPLAAAIAINPSSIWHQPALWLLSAMVLCWVSGFDVIYALQDVDIDRAQNLHSIPARLGVQRGLWVSRGLHAAAVMCLAAALWIDSRFSLTFGIGIALVSALLTYEHLTVARWGASRIALAFFTLNGIISCILGALGILDVLVV